MHAEIKPERVLFIAAQMEARGTNEYVSYLACELQRRGVGVAVFCAPGPMIEVLGKKGIGVETFPHLGGVKSTTREKTGFLGRLREFDPDIIHAPGLNALKSYREVAGEEFNTPVIVTMHSAPARPRSLRAAASLIDGIIATSQKVREEIVNDARFPRNRTAMICNGIDIEEINRETVSPVFSRPLPVIGSVGPVERARGHELFIQAASLLTRAGKNAQFVIAGEGDEVSRLARLGSKAGLDKNLTFVRDFASYHEVLDALDVVVQSSQVDVSGFSILDAMGRGRPVVAFNTGTACEIISDRKTGLVVQKVDPEALAALLMELIDNPLRGREMGEAARRNVSEKFNIRKTTDAVIDFYLHVLTENE